VGDCNGNNEVAINELIVGVNIALQSAALETCASFDANDTGEVEINELIQGVSNALNGCPSGEPECGNNVKEAGEDCDDGNTFGGDGCAANCTDEVATTCILDPTVSQATLQSQLFAIPLPNVSGEIILTHGSASSNGQIPVVLRASDVTLEPIPVPGLLCACVRGGEEADDFGPGNAGSGNVGCGSEGLAEVDYVATRDHNIGDVDAECATGTRETCSTPGPQCHPGVCNGPLGQVYTAGGPQGSVLIQFSMSIGQIADGGICDIDPTDPAKGPDGIPCTDDDPNVPAGIRLPLTTGTAEGIVLDANNSAGKSIAKEQRCGAPNCSTVVTGAGVDCSVIGDSPEDAFSGSALGGALASLDLASVGDSVITALFACQ
jgi:cysteine-rich repeat protein